MSGWSGFGKRAVCSDRRDAFEAFLRALQRAHGLVGRRIVEVTDGARRHVEEEGARMALEVDLGCQDEAAKPVSNLSPDEAWGAGYVLVGSCLGATSILKSRRLGKDWPTCYLRHGQSLAKNGAVLRYFQALDSHAPESRAALAGAEWMFAQIAGDAASRIGAVR